MQTYSFSTELATYTMSSLNTWMGQGYVHLDHQPQAETVALSSLQKTCTRT